MGVCWSGTSKSNFVDNVDGNEEDFHNVYLEDALLGQGEFGVVKLVHDMKDNQTYAVKVLRKGMQLKDNVLYAPMKPEVLKQECLMLRLLQGKHYCLRLYRIYESPRLVFLVTEVCSGGEMMEYVSKLDELDTRDVSRIAFQLLDAIQHCDACHILHRDVKPGNVMFVTPNAGADLRLIDFGSGCIDATTTTTLDKNDAQPTIHTTFAGSAFYISPEMFQRTYTSKTDVWSVGVTLYVLVAGYPADELQKAFNLLHKSKNRNLRDLPNLPSTMPLSFFNLLEELLQYRHKMRKSAKELLQHDFITSFQPNNKQDESIISLQGNGFHDASNTNNNNNNNNTTATKRINLQSSVKRHSLFLDYKTFERSVTTLIATLLSKDDFDALLEKLKTNKTSTTHELNIIKISQLKSILKEMNQELCIKKMEQLPGAMSYNSFAYHVELLEQFQRLGSAAASSSNTKNNNRSLRRFSSFGDQGGGLSRSAHGPNVYKEMAAQRNQSMISSDNHNKPNDNLSNSWHLGQSGA